VLADKAVYVPAALIKVLIPNSLKRSLLGFDEEQHDVNVEPRVKPPKAAPETGRIDRFLIACLRFITIFIYIFIIKSYLLDAVAGRGAGGGTRGFAIPFRS